MVRERAARRGVALELEVEPGLGVVLADELKLKQVVLNLLTNAVKFTNAGGTVGLAALRAGDTLEVEVRDTGVGIAEADQARVFEAFQRGGRHARTSTEGTGLGLTLSRRFVELHGGRMWMESELGAGSRFGFAIPATAPAEAPDAAGARRRARAPAVVSANTVRGDTRTVVVIDDDPLELDLVEAVLVPEGYDVVRAADGAEGVQLAAGRSGERTRAWSVRCLGSSRLAHVGQLMQGPAAGGAASPWIPRRGCSAAVALTRAARW